MPNDSAKVSGANLVAAVGLDKVAQISAEQISSIGSQDMNDKVWFDLAARIKTGYREQGGRRYSDHHGTDTMEDTVFFLQ